MAEHVSAIGDLERKVHVLLDKQHAGAVSAAIVRSTGSNRSTMMGARPKLISSTINNFGFTASALAIANICYSPPDSSPARRSIKPSSAGK